MREKHCSLWLWLLLVILIIILEFTLMVFVTFILILSLLLVLLWSTITLIWDLLINFSSLRNWVSLSWSTYIASLWVFNLIFDHSLTLISMLPIFLSSSLILILLLVFIIWLVSLWACWLSFLSRHIYYWLFS